MVLLETPKSKKYNDKKVSKKVMPILFITKSFKTLTTSISFTSSPGTPSSPSGTSHHNLSESMMEENIENAELVITKWEASGNSKSITNVNPVFHHDRREAKEFLRSVKAINRAMDYFVSRNSGSEKLVLATNLMQIAMNRLEKEFRRILSETPDQLCPESVSGKSSDSLGSSGKEVHGIELEEGFMSDLKLIADCMITSGFSQDCIRAYKLIRKSRVEEELYILGVEHYRTSQVSRMSWEAQARMTKNWVKAVKVAVRKLFNGEKVLCDYVFSESQWIRESCFLEITNEGAINLFRFPEIITKTKIPPEMIFVLMEMYENLFGLLPQIESIFNSESTSGIKTQALSSLLKLGESVRVALQDFEERILKDSSKAPVPGGGVHQLTITVMEHVSSLGNYSAILSKIVADSCLPGKVALPKSYFEGSKSDKSSTPAVAFILARLILVLLCKLDNKSEVYKDKALSYLFLANNLQFILEKVCTSRLRVLFGEEWLLNHARKVINYATNYETIAWSGIMSILPNNNGGKLSPEAVKETFLKFNAAFEEAYRRQASWIVPDRKLRDELKLSISKNVMSAYREFYEKYLMMTMSSRKKDREVVVKFVPDDLENYLSDLFHGDHSISSSSTSSCSSSNRYIHHYNSS